MSFKQKNNFRIDQKLLIQRVDGIVKFNKRIRIIIL